MLTIKSKTSKLGYQVLGDDLQALLFPHKPEGENPSKFKVFEVRQDLDKLGFELPKTEQQSLDIPFLPDLKGLKPFDFLEEISEIMYGPVKRALQDFINIENSYHNNEFRVYDQLKLEAGWTKYPYGSSIPFSVKVPEETALVYDTETLVRKGSFPIMAAVMSNKAYYVWLHPCLVQNVDFYPTLIPIGQNKVIFNHNVMYDMARTEETYIWDKHNRNFHICSQSMHIAIAGMGNQQRALHKLWEQGKANYASKWAPHTSMNNLVDVYNLHVKPFIRLSEDDKELRDIFVKASDEKLIKENLHVLVNYAINDVRYTYELGCYLIPKFFYANPCLTTFGGMLEVNSGILPVIKDWKKWLNNVDKTYEEESLKLNKELTKLAEELVQDWLEGKVDVNNPWYSCLDWTPAKSGQNKGLPHWYRNKILSKKNKKGEYPLTTKSPLASLLLKLQWGNSPIVYLGKKKFCYECDKGEYGSFLYEGKYYARVPHPKGGNKNCFPVNTVEALTKKGWKPLKDIKVGEKVLCHDRHKGLNWFDCTGYVNGGFQPVLDYGKFQATANHRWLVLPKNEKPGDLINNRFAEDIYSKAYRLLMSGEMQHPSKYYLTEEECVFLGFLLGDGRLAYQAGTRKVQCSITQAKFTKELEDILCGIGSKYSKKENPGGPDSKLQSYKYHISSYWIKDFLEAKLGCNLDSFNWVALSTGFSKTQAKHFCKGVYLAEGHLTYEGWQVSQCSIKNKDKYDAILISMVLAGERVSVRDSHVKFITANKHKCLNTDKDFRSKIKTLPEQEVECITTAVGNFVMRQDNFISVTGNCGNPLGKDYIKAIDIDLMKSEDPRSRGFMMTAKSISYWSSYQSRAHNYFAVENTHEGFNGNLICPQILAYGTVTRRSVESFFLTLSDPKPAIIGSEAKSRIQLEPDDDRVLVGADMDAQEMRIGSAMADSYHGLLGSSAMSLTQMLGSKKDKTDSHSLLAKYSFQIINKDTRDTAKGLNFQMLFLSGLSGCTSTVKKNRPDLNEDECKEIASKALRLRRGEKVYEKNKKGVYKYQGGTDSHCYNYMITNAYTPDNRTPLFKSAISEPLKFNRVGKEFMTSRCNRSIQSSGSDLLHALTVLLNWFFMYEYKLDARFIIAIHDELRACCKKSDKELVAWIFQMSSMITYSAFYDSMGFETLPFNYLGFSEVNIDRCLRKESHGKPEDGFSDTITKSNDIPVEQGLGYGIGDLAHLRIS